MVGPGERRDASGSMGENGQRAGQRVYGQSPAPVGDAAGRHAAPAPQNGTEPAPATFEELAPPARHGDPWFRRVSREVVQGVGAKTPQQAGQRTQLAQALQRPVTTGRRIAVASVRGGAGKSTVSALVGSAIARHRGDRVVVVDGDPDVGSVSVRLGADRGMSLRAMFASGGQPASFEQLSPYLGQAPTGLWVVSGHRDSSAGPTIDAGSFVRAQPVLSRYFAVSLIDCGAGLYSELTRTVLARVHALLLVTQATADGVRSAREAMDQLAQTFYRPLLARCVLALVSHTPERTVGMRTAVRTLSAYGVEVLPMPYDRHLAAGAAIDLRLVSNGVQEFTVQAGAEVLLRSTWS